MKSTGRLYARSAYSNTEEERKTLHNERRKAMRALYEIDADIINCVDEETGEILDLEKLNALQIERTAKIEGVALYIKQLRYEAAAIREEEKALAERRKKKEKLSAGYEKWLEEVLSGQAFETSKVALAWRGSERAEITGDMLDLAAHLEKLGYDYCVKYGEMSIDKNEVKRLLKQGVEIPGAVLKQYNNLQMK